MKKMKFKGSIEFCLGEDGIEYRVYDRKWYMGEYKNEQIVDMILSDTYTRDIYHLFDGMEFLDNVESKCIMDDDGQIADIFVDGYISNLGLAHNNLTQGMFLVTPSVWEDICDEFKVEVNWANK